MIPLDHRDRGNRADPYTEPNSCLSDSSHSLNSLNSLNSMKILLHLEKTLLFDQIFLHKDKEIGTRGHTSLASLIDPPVNTGVILSI